MLKGVRMCAMAGPVVSMREGRKGPTVMWRDQPDQRSFDILPFGFTSVVGREGNKQKRVGVL